jgi:hypothetical protein
MRNIILVTGSMAGGKTDLIHHVMGDFSRQNIPFDPLIITDSTYMVDAVVRDHRETDGMHHIHGEGQQPSPHAYDQASEHLTFINVSSQMQRWMFQPFFADIPRLTDDDQYHFVEGAVGVNRTSPELLTSRNDYSCQSLVEGFRSGIYDSSWIPRVAVIIHVTSDYGLREQLNNEIRRRKSFLIGQDQTGDASRPLPPAVLLFTKDDDFPHLKNYLVDEQRLNGRVMTIKNDGTPSFFERALAALEWQGIIPPEGQSARKEMR